MIDRERAVKQQLLSNESRSTIDSRGHFYLVYRHMIRQSYKAKDDAAKLTGFEALFGLFCVSNETSDQAFGYRPPWRTSKWYPARGQCNVPTSKVSAPLHSRGYKEILLRPLKLRNAIRRQFKSSHPRREETKTSLSMWTVQRLVIVSTGLFVHLYRWIVNRGRERFTIPATSVVVPSPLRRSPSSMQIKATESSIPASFDPPSLLSLLHS